MKYLLGIDNGGTMSKAAVFDLAGRELAVAGRPVRVSEPHPGWSERDMDALWRDTAAAIREAVAKAGVNPAEIAAVACTGHGNGLYLVDAAGVPVRPAINSTDQRAQAIVAQWRADGVDVRALPRTTQCVWPAQPNALLAWLRAHEPAALDRAAAVLMCKDFIRFRLTGEIAAELTDMSGTSLMNVVTGQYDDEVLRLFGIEDCQHLLPRLVKTADLCGRVTAAAAAETGLQAGTPVAGGMFDIDACGLASGMVDEKPMSLVAGTWGNNQYIARAPLVDRELFMTSCYSIPGWYLMLEGSPTSAANLDWFVREWFGAEHEAAARAGRSIHEQCLDEALGVPAGDAVPVFLPFLYGSNATPGAKAGLVGLEGRHTRAHVMRAVCEGIVFAHQTHLERLLKFRPRPEVIRFTGGAARSEGWVQMFADSFQIPIEIPAGSELGALGAAIAAAVAAGLYTGYAEAVRAMTRIARRQEPDPARKGIYGERYARYHRVIRALEGVWPQA